MAAQCWALFILKWTMIRRGLGKEHFFSYLILAVLFLGGLFISLVATLGLYALARRTGQHQSPLVLLVLLDGVVLLYCFFYAWGILMEIQRTDLLDFKKMLQLPISMSAVYLMNFLVSLFGPLLFFSIPPLLGLLSGLYPFYGSRVFFAGIPMAGLLVLLLGAWSYYLRGRLAILMENPRRRRFVFMLVPMGFILLAQLPAVITHIAAKTGSGLGPGRLLETLQPHLIRGNQVVPLLWPAYGLWTGISGAGFAMFFLCAAGLLLAALIGLRFGYVTTLRHYMGMYTTTSGKALPSARNPISMPVTGRGFPFVDEDTAALIYAFYKSFTRHPHVRMLIIMPLCFGLFVLFMQRSGAYGNVGSREQDWIPMAALVWPFVNFSFFMFNIFGIDAQSFQTLQLSPLPRYKYLLAKNMAIAPVVLGLVVFFVAVSALLTHASGKTLFISLLLAIHLFLIFCTAGNLLSIKFPRRLHRDALRIPERRLRMLTTSLLTMFFSVVLVTPAVICLLLDRYSSAVVRGPYAGYFSLALAFILAGGGLLLYRLALTHAGDLLTAEETCIYTKMVHESE